MHMHHQLAAAGPLPLAAAFVAGIAASVHCVAMCGGIAGALGMRARHSGVRRSAAFGHAVIHQFGRIGSYAVAGANCGAFGGAMAALFDTERLALVLRAAAGALLIGMALRVLFGWRLLGGLERLGAALWRRFAPIARSIPSRGLAGSLLLGALWGWLPCGLVYSMLVFAALAGGAAKGASTMMLYGLGTLPAMFGGSLAGAQIWRHALARQWHAAAGALLLVFGVITVLGPLQHLHP